MTATREEILSEDLEQAERANIRLLGEIKRLRAELAAERERCAQVADSMNSTQDIGDRIRYGLGHGRDEQK